MPNTTEKRKKRRGALLSALVTGGFFVLMAVGMLLAGFEDGMTAGEGLILALCALLYLVIAGGICVALRQRWKEIETGEEDEARKY